MILMNHSPPPAPFMIAAPQLFDGAVMRGPALVAVSGGFIESVSFGDALPPGIPALPPDAILAPGFIDIQVNGGGGVLLNDEPGEAGVRRIVEAHRRTETTGCLPTLITDRTDVIERLAARLQQVLLVSIRPLRTGRGLRVAGWSGGICGRA
jgi:N-acetylglucosamine-6-phosphate deacetylase